MRHHSTVTTQHLFGTYPSRTQTLETFVVTLVSPPQWFESGILALSSERQLGILHIDGHSLDNAAKTRKPLVGESDSPCARP